jgi:hypothetical protein
MGTIGGGGGGGGIAEPYISDWSSGISKLTKGDGAGLKSWGGKCAVAVGVRGDEPCADSGDESSSSAGVFPR